MAKILGSGYDKSVKVAGKVMHLTAVFTTSAEAESLAKKHRNKGYWTMITRFPYYMGVRANYGVYVRKA